MKSKGAKETMKFKLPIKLRQLCDGDVNFVLNSWLKSYEDSGWIRATGKAYWRGHRVAILRLIATANIQIACSADDPDTIVGWACTRGRFVHYVYVKRVFRRFGVAKLLLTSDLSQPRTYTHRCGKKLSSRVPANWQYDPYPALLGEYDEDA